MTKLTRRRIHYVLRVLGSAGAAWVDPDFHWPRPMRISRTSHIPVRRD